MTVDISHWCHNISAQMPGSDWSSRFSPGLWLVEKWQEVFVGPRGAGGVNQALSLNFKQNVCAIIFIIGTRQNSFEIKLPLKQSLIPSKLSQLWSSGFRFRCSLAAREREIENSFFTRIAFHDWDPVIWKIISTQIESEESRGRNRFERSRYKYFLWGWSSDRSWRNYGLFGSGGSVEWSALH